MDERQVQDSELTVTLLHNSPIYLVARAARVCTDTIDKMTSVGDTLSPKDRKLIIDKILGNVKDTMNPPHESVVEHVNYTFDIDGVSRALLQELMRHRIASPSVQSTRYALKKVFRKATSGEELTDEVLNRMLVLTGNDLVDDVSGQNLLNLIELFRSSKAEGIKIPNDILKFPLPESFKVHLQFTLNARSLRNFFVLRTSKRAMWEIRRLAYAMYEVLPDHHKFLFADRLHQMDKGEC